MADVFEIPLTSGAQEFVCALGEKSYRLRLTWKTAEMGGWVLDVLDAVTENPVVAGILVSVGNDLFAPYRHLGLGHLVALLDSKDSGYPTYADMGTLFKLYWRA